MDAPLRQPGRVGGIRLTRSQVRALRAAGIFVLALVLLLPLVWVLFLAPTTGAGATSFGSIGLQAESSRMVIVKPKANGFMRMLLMG